MTILPPTPLSPFYAVVTPNREGDLAMNLGELFLGFVALRKNTIRATWVSGIISPEAGHLSLCGLALPGMDFYVKLMD